MNKKSVDDKIRVLLVDDEDFFLQTTSKALSSRGCDVRCASCAESAIEQLETRFFDAVLLDIRMPGMDGLELLDKLHQERPTQQVIMVTGQATIPMAVQAMKLGAFDFILKPASIDDILRILNRAAERSRLERTNIALKEELQRTRIADRLIGESQAIKKVMEFIDTASQSDLPVLIIGESGTGKELVARSIHEKSKRSRHPLVVVDGATLREGLIISELFGHEKGAFTSAVRKKAGLFELADKSSAFFDEIGELSTLNQAALLRVIEYGTFRSVGGIREVSTDVRIIAATNRNIKEMVKQGEFREDLFYRLNGLSLTIEPLRERRSDIPMLARYFLDRYNLSANKKVKFSAAAFETLASYDWPGNVRELLYVVERAALISKDEETIQPRHLPDEVRSPSAVIASDTNGFTSDRPSLAVLQDRYEKSYIAQLLSEYKGNKSEVARTLGISRSVLYEKLHHLGLGKT